MIIDKFKNENYEITIKINNIYIKNYIRIIDMSQNKITIKLKNIIININGIELLIVKMDKCDLAIKGNIKGIDFINE